MNKRTRRCKADGGDITSTVRSFSSKPRLSLGMRAIAPTLYAHGGGVSAKEIASGKAAGARHGESPAARLSRGQAECVRKGHNAKSIGMGHPEGRRKFATGGHAANVDPETGNERLRKARQRNEILGSPHYARGGKIPAGMKGLYRALHSDFEKEPQMKKLRATKKDVYEGEPHRYKRATGGRLWIQGAINPSKKGALHESLHVPKGQKIPMSKIQKAEHSKSPLLRERANLAARLRKFHP